MRQKLALSLGALMIAGGLLGASVTFGPSDLSADAQERRGEEQIPSDAHEQMHAMMGEGASERMHEAMPNSEQMMEACVSGMGNMMDGMMNGQEGR